MNNLDWNDLRYVLAVARGGSAAAAARALQVSHATVLRRIQEVESRFALEVFQRTPGGHELTEAGRVVFELAETVETQVSHAQRLVDAQGSQMQGEIRFTTTDALFDGAVLPLLASFQQRFPGIKVRTFVSNSVLDIEKRMADVTLRPSTQPPDTLVGLRLCRMDFAVYASRAFLAQQASTPLAQMDWLMPDESLSRIPVARWLEAGPAPSNVRHTFNSFVALRRAAEADLGVAALPRFLGNASSSLVVAADAPRSASNELWLLTHPSLRRSARMHAFMDHVAQGVRAQRAAFESGD